MNRGTTTRRRSRTVARRAGTRRTVAATTALTLALAGAVVTTGLTATAPPPAAAAPGDPGVPQPPVPLFSEDYENAGDGQNLLLPDYVGLQTTYTADPPWADRPNCNGFVIDATSTQLPEDCTNADSTIGTETPEASFDHLQGMTTAIGEHAGDPSPETNAAVAYYTSNAEPIASGLVVGASQTPITVPDERQVVLSADVAAMNCESSPSVLMFDLVDDAGNRFPITDQGLSPNFEPCGFPETTVTTPDGEEITVHVGTFTSSLFHTGVNVPPGSYTIEAENGVGVGQGNDFVIDNVWAEDVTNQLDKSFDPAVTPVGSTSTLTFTVTNTSELGPKPAYSFTDDLAPGLVVADPPNATDTCGQYFWGPVAGATTLSVNGPAFPEGFETCTFSVDVTSDTAAVYTNGPDDISALTGLAPPADATVEFTDDEPEAGLTITKTADVADAAPGDTVTYTVVVENSGEVAYTDDDPATFTDDLAGVLDDATFVAADADAGTVDTSALPTLTWSGALGVGETATVTAEVTVDDPPGGDGVLTNVVTGPGESTCVDGTEDGCSTSTPVRGLTITKSAEPDEALVPGEEIAYTITVANTGRYDYTADDPATISDDMSELLDDAAYEGDAAADVGTVDDSALPVITWSGPLAVGATATITYTVAVGEEGSGDGTAVNRVTGPPESNCVDGTEDGCFVVIPPSGLAVTKTADATVVVPGDTVTYTVTVTNSGDVPYTAGSPAAFTDDLTEVLDDATYDGDAAADVGSVDDSALPALTWSGALDVGETATVTYSVTVDDPVTGDGVLTNVVTGPVESTCVDGTEEGCTTTTRVRSLEIVKVADPAETLPGGVVGYTVTVENTGQAPYTVVAPATFDDDLSGVLDDATYDGDATADTGSVDDSALPTLTWTGTLDPGEVATVTYSVTVDDPVTGDHLLDNVVTGPDESSCSGVEPGAVDGCSTSTPVRELTILKSATPDQDLVPGEQIVYTVTVTNSGEVDYPTGAPATVTDDLSAVVDDATYGDDASADVGTVDDSALPTLTWSGALAVGETATITYSVTVDDPGTGDGTALNTVTGPPASNCLDGTEEGCSVTIPPRALEITKSADVAEVLPGGTVTYTIVVENTGDVPYTAGSPATVTDDAAGVADDAAYAGDATADVGTVDDGAFPALVWSGALAPGEVATITYSVTVADPLTGDGVLDNTVTGPVEGTCDAGADPVPAGCATSTPVRALAVTKEAEPASVAPGGTVTYTVTVENVGRVAYDGADPAWFTDDLSGVLDDATYDGDADPSTGATQFASPALQWRGALAPGDVATVTYSVTVADPVTGDHSLDNVITGPPESTCTDGTEGGCSTSTPVSGLTILKSATPDDALVPGEDVAYTITVTNSGQVPYTDADPATVTDDMSDLLDDATYAGDATADVGTVDDSALPTLTWSGPLAVGETATIAYTVTTGPAGSGDGVAENVVTGPAESSCATGTEDGCSVTIPPRSLDVAKSVDVAQAAPGDTLTYTVTVTNDGTVGYGPDRPAVVVDDLTDVLTGATYDGDAAATSGTVDDSALPDLVWTGVLAPGESATLTFSVTVDEALDTETTLVNTVTGPAESSCSAVPSSAAVAEPGAAPSLAPACSAQTVVVPPTPSPVPTTSPTPTPSPTPAPTPTDGGTPTAAPAPSPTVPGGDPLPWTGADVAAVVAVAVLLLVTGAVLLGAVRRRRTQD
ncbi:DUF11 domain-containing protein [Isoptericola dokdonensis]|uniref:DUF7927 domain-containing protein n=1 Tax=Isoptericola dokdonensis TaxID=372663 RepID=UPI0012F88C08|nr:DUF11 domain-containing protein [Isoptericola dokdonensis]